MADSSTEGQGAKTIRLPKWRAGPRAEVEAPPPDPVEVTPPPSTISTAESRSRPGPASRAIGILLSAPALGLAWLGVVFASFQYTLGWQQLFYLQPYELAGIFVGSMSPLVLIWFVAFHRRGERALQGSVDALERRLAELAYPAEEVAARVEQVSAALRQQSEMLTGASDHALARAQEVEASLRQQCRELGTAAEQAAAQAQSVRDVLHQQSERLDAMSERVTGQSNDILAALARQTGELDQALTQTTERARRAGAEISTQGEALQSMAAQAAKLDEAMRELGRGLESSAAQAAARVGDIDKAIERQSKQLRGAAAIVNASIEDMGQSLRQRLDQLSAATDQALRKINDVGDAYREHAQTYTDAADRAARQIERLARATPAEALTPPEAIPSQFRRPTTEPDDSAPGAEKKPRPRMFGRGDKESTDRSEPIADEPSGVEARRDAFLRSATFVVDNLNSIAIDLNRLLERDIPRGVWRVFHRGDKSAFTRRVLDTRSLRDQKRIRRKFRQDPEFREHASHYVTEFESLMQQAENCDYENLLRTTFLTADVGKLYLLLSRAVGRQIRS